MTGSAARLRKKKLIIGIAAIIVAAIVISSFLFVYYSPAHSWSSSIRDHDGDGVPDKSDPKPFDSDIWALRMGYINLTLYVNSSYNLTFHFTISSTDLNVYYLVNASDLFLVYPEGTFEVADSYGNLILSIPTGWRNGPVSVNVTVGIHSEFFYWIGSVIVTDAQTTTLDLICPDDFAFGGTYGTRNL